MPPKAAKRKATKAAAASEDDDLWGAPVDQPRKRARLSGSRAEEDSQDAGRKATKQTPSWADWQKKFNDKEKDDKRQFASVFKQNIEKRRENIMKLIGESTTSINKAGKKHTEQVKKACADMEPASKTTSKSNNGTPETVQDSPMFKTLQIRFNEYRELVAAHEQANSHYDVRPHTQTDERRALWKGDMEEAQKAASYGAQYGEKIVRCTVDLSNRDESKVQLLTPARGEKLSGAGLMALDMHQRSVEALAGGEATWGEQALMYLDRFEGITAVCAALCL